MHSPEEDLWDEWASFPLSSEERATSEAAGIVTGLRAGVRTRKNAPDEIFLSSSRLWVLRRLLKIWRLSGWERVLDLSGRTLVSKTTKGPVRLALPEDVYEEVTRFAPQRNWDWMRGLWGSCGSLYFPKSGYYLALRLKEKDVFSRVGKILQRARILWSERAVHSAWEAILRDQEEIVTFLSKIGLSGVSLSIEDRAVLRSVRNRANRMRNCDTANIRKTLKVAEEQLELARKLKREGRIETLPGPLRSLVEARLEYPESSLAELGDVLSPPVTKSTIKYRWKRLCELLSE
ncbi:MAG: DNA-binding protein WhiA [Synergistaceae bacterium]|jgi:DNA-binding protein WhiA|nr:DNA-binding protein WhiA [Synergistaceae bacterium]